MGHPDSNQGHFGKGVSLRFPGNKRNTSCYLSNISRSKPWRAPDTPRVRRYDNLNFMDKSRLSAACAWGENLSMPSTSDLGGNYASRTRHVHEQ